MKNFVCWNEESVIAATPRDAVTLSPATFQAIHHPLKLKRRQMEQESGGVSIDEGRLLEVMRGALRPDGYLFVPVVGGSGTGKSHLVRWARENLEGTAGWEIRYLPKNGTSIRRVIEEVIDGMEGPVAEKARRDLEAAAPSSESPEVLADRLLDELAILIGLLASQEGDGRSPQEAHFVEQKREQLADICRDPVVRRRLKRDGAVIPRLVALAMAGRTPGDGLDDDAVFVASDDLPGVETELAAAGIEVRAFLDKMQSIPEFLTMSVALINEVLPAAIRRVFISNEIDLADVFREVRCDLLSSGKELVLFIEDLTVLHGVEREFLDAIVETAVQSGEKIMAPLRMLFAVTDGHLKALDTFRTRCDAAFWLDSEYEAADGIGRDEAASFVGRYFNAGRLGAQELVQAWGEGGESWLPNACMACEHQEVCHSTFGATEEGFGLYPLNGEALDRFVSALSPNRFDPRRLVGAIANQFLLEGGRELQRSEFPSRELLEPFRQANQSDDLDPLLLTELRTGAREQADRVFGVVRYWGGGRDAPATVLSSFDLRPIDLPEITTGPSRMPEKSAQNQSAASGQPSSSANFLNAADKAVFDLLGSWANDGAEIGTTAASRLRKLVHASVKPGLEYGPVPLNLSAAFYKARFDPQKHIAFEGSVSFKKSDVIRIERSPENASALRGLLLLESRPSFSAMESGDRYRLNVADRVEEWTSAVQDSLNQIDDEAVFAKAKGLIMVARLLGTDDGDDEPSQILSGLFRPFGAGSPLSELRSSHWKKMIESAQKYRQNVAPEISIYFGEARGTGAVRAVRANLLLPLISEVTSSWDFTSDDADLATVLRHVPQAIESEWARLSSSLAEIGSEIDDSAPVAAQLERCIEALGKAAQLGRFHNAEQLRELRTGVGQLSEEHDRAIKRSSDAHASAKTEQDKVRILASELPDRVREIRELMASATAQLAGVEDDLASRRRDLGDPVDAVSVVTEILKEASALREAAAKVSS